MPAVALLDHLIRLQQQRRRDRQAEGLGGLEIPPPRLSRDRFALRTSDTRREYSAPQRNQVRAAPVESSHGTAKRLRRRDSLFSAPFVLAAPQRRTARRGGHPRPAPESVGGLAGTGCRSWDWRVSWRGDSSRRTGDGPASRTPQGARRVCQFCADTMTSQPTYGL